MVDETDRTEDPSDDDAEAPTDRREMLSDFSRFARARTTTERHGDGTLTLVDRMPQDATGYLLAHEEQAGPVAAPARRLAPLPIRMFLSVEPDPFDPDTLGLSAVWARPLPVVNDITAWRRGRLLIQPDALLFVDEPAAEILKPRPSRDEAEISIERALWGSDRARTAAAASELWCSLLYATLNATSWYHPTSGTVNKIGGRSLGEFIANLRGSGGYLDWYCGPNFGQDELILTLMRELGWAPVPPGEFVLPSDWRNQPAPQVREGL